MLAQNGTSYNGVHVTPSYPPCSSDYEPAPTTHVTSKTPRTGWRDAFPPYTHNLSWVDADGLSHSMTLRSDDLQGLMADLRLLKCAIKQAKQQHAQSNPQLVTPAALAASAPKAMGAQPDVMHCHIHGTSMARRWSKRTNGHYFAHKLPTGDFCYGKTKS